MCANTLLIFFAYLVLSTVAEDAAFKEKGYLATCPLSVLDLTIFSTSTDSVKLKMVVGGSGNFHTYNISKAASIISDPAFRKDFRTVLYVPGFVDGPGRVSGPKIIEAYLVRGRHNILLLDTNGLTDIEYFRSARIIRYIGIRLGKVLSQFRKSGLNMDTLDLVGHSLGAQALGFAGKSYFKSTGIKLPRIAALDPAAPCFKGVDEDNRLSKNDAEFVQVIHTNGGILGIRIPMGHVDFYPNGGSKQPPTYGISCSITCSHNRAVDLWKFAVIYPNKFYGVKCSGMDEVDQDMCFKKGRKIAVMGPDVDPRIQGIFYVRTSNREPFFEEVMDDVRQKRKWC